MLGIIIGAIAGFLVGKDAQKNNMNPWVWGIFTFLILIVGLPVYLIVRANRRIKRGTTPENNDILDS